MGGVCHELLMLTKYNNSVIYSSLTRLCMYFRDPENSEPSLDIRESDKRENVQFFRSRTRALLVALAFALGCGLGESACSAGKPPRETMVQAQPKILKADEGKTQPEARKKPKKANEKIRKVEEWKGKVETDKGTFRDVDECILYWRCSVV